MERGEEDNQEGEGGNEGERQGGFKISSRLLSAANDLVLILVCFPPFESFGIFACMHLRCCFLP